MGHLATTLDWIVLFVYTAFTLGVGLYMGRASNQPEEYVVAGHRIPTWAVGLSIFGTYVSSISFLALPGKAFASNWNVFVFSLAIPLATWVAAKYFVPFYRRLGAISSYEHLEHRFGSWARFYAMSCYLLTQQARIGTILYLTAIAIAPITGGDIKILIILSGAIVIAYTYLGGIKAVIWTDVLQSVVLIGGALICLALMIFQVPGGLPNVIKTGMATNKLALGSWEWDFSQPTVWVVFLYGLFINLQNFGIDQSYVQRYQTAATEKSAVKSVWLGALMYIPISGVFLLLGTCLYVFYLHHPEKVPPGGFPTPDAAFPHFILSCLPPGISGLVIAAIFAAAQSTISGSINSSATLIAWDIYKRLITPNANQTQMMRVLRIASAGVGIGGTLFALGMINIKGALDVWWELASLFSGGMLGLFLLGLISRANTNSAALAGTLTSILTIAWITLSEKIPWKGQLIALKSPFHTFMGIVVGTLVLMLVGILLSGLSKSPTPNNLH